MTLVEQLREAGPDIIRNYCDPYGDTCLEAAARIEQLEAELASAQQSATFFSDESMCRKATIEQLEAENAALRDDAERMDYEEAWRALVERGVKNVDIYDAKAAIDAARGKS